MKNLNEHVLADLLLLGYTDPQVHYFLDASVKYLGPAHRLDKHDFPTIKLLNDIWGEKSGNIALLHILLDLHILNDNLVLKIIKEERKR